MVETGLGVRGLGWLPDHPDIRDYSPGHPAVEALTGRLGLAPGAIAPVPAATADLRPWCSPIEDQGKLGSCTANAAAGALECLEKRAYGKYVDASRLFIYKATRDLLGSKGDTGAFLRTTLGALVLFGAPPEPFWPYDVDRFDDEPSAFLYGMGCNYRALQYVRLDSGVGPADLLLRVKQYLAGGMPCVFGFSVYASIAQAANSGMVPFPTANDKMVGGHAVMAAGYDDHLGAFLFRNSWGPAWGQAGYGWLPYDYLLKGLAVDWWVLLSSSWVDTAQFGL